MPDDQIGIANKTPHRGIPTTTVGWGTSYTQYTLEIFTDVSKTPMNDMAKMNDNSGELLSQKRRNKRIQLKFSAKPIGATASAAQNIAENLPAPGDIVKITCADDAQVACDLATDTTIVDDASAKYSPEGELVVDMTVTKWLGKVFVAQT